MRELNSDEIDLVAGGATHRPIPSPGSPGVLSGDVVRFFTDAANGAPKATLISDGKAVLSDLLGGSTSGGAELTFNNTRVPIKFDFFPHR
jgi:hypothetical protein